MSNLKLKPSLSRQFIEQQRKRLETLREQLIGAVAKTTAKNRTFQEEYGGEAQEFEDRAHGMAQNELYQSLHNLDERRLRNIDRALRKINEGTYGLSDLSGEPIPKARLDAAPEAILTVEEEARVEEQ
jgi:DnaK suppressor protein